MSAPIASRLATRRAVLQSAAAAVAAAALPPIARSADEAVLDDASHLNATPVARHVVIRPDDEAALIERLRRELREAAAAGRPVAMGTARHSMGGQSLARHGTALTFATPVCEPDRSAGTYRARLGTRWRDVIATLDSIGFSPKVMQANNDFGIASTFSVNAHGWPVPCGPMGSTVRGLRLMLADGTIVTCSRQENAELFRHVMGGYGLFGIILDLDVEMTPNLLLAPSFEHLPGAAFGARFPAVCADPSVAMAYGRLDVSRDNFLKDALLISYRPQPTPAGGLPAAADGAGIVSSLERQVYRAEAGSERAKHFRWYLESTLEPRVGAVAVTRNRLLNESAALLAEHNPKRTDILHEYFVAPEHFPAFLTACREVILKTRLDLLNVTLRYVTADPDSVLAYAPTTRIAAVMSFSQARTAAADAAMQATTRDLVERVLAIGGSFYLPYRLHARADQVARAYPRLAEFAECKRRYDPGRLFRNALWDKWLEEPGKEKD